MNDFWRSLHRRAREYAANLPIGVGQAVVAAIPSASYTDEVIPFDIYRNTRKNIECIADQINHSYCVGIYDGCQVLMRRLMEMLLILSFKQNGVEDEIRGPEGDYLQLSQIVDKAIQSKKLDLTKNAKDYMDIFREKGNLSAHNPFHSARQKDLDVVQPPYRHLVEELMYKAGIFK